jgi:hypothetical protein
MYSSIDDFNDLTLSLMTNKTYYAEYLEKTNPVKFKKLEEYKKKINKYSSKILNMTKELLRNPDKSFNTETNDIFIEYTKVLIRYIEMKDLEDSNENSSSSSSSSAKFGEDEDMLFNVIEEPKQPDSESEVEPDSDNDCEVHWSKDKVRKL